MKVVILSFGMFVGGFAGAKDLVPADGWHTVTQSKSASVSVERVFYEKKGNPHFFVKVRITNLSSAPTFVDLRDYSRVAYPNQWGVLRTDERVIIDESRIIIAAPDAEYRKKLREGKLTAIPAGGYFDYFREFNASGRRDVEKQERELKGAKNIFVSMDGQLLFTDGSEVTQLTCSWDDDKVATDVILPVPMTWKSVPEKAFVVEDK